MISTRGRYALRMMLDLAANQADGYVALKDVAARQGISKKYLEQIIPVLNRAGLLQTTRGVQGGYRLTRRLGTGKVTAISVAMTAVALWGFSVSSAFWQLCLWAVPYGLGAGSVDASLNNYVALHY